MRLRFVRARRRRRARDDGTLFHPKSRLSGEGTQRHNRKETTMWTTIEYLGLALIPGFILLDLVVRSRSFETPRLWRVRATVVTVLTGR